MSTRPQISVRRPARTMDASTDPPMPVAHTAVPKIDLDDADALAFSMRGRATLPERAAASPTPSPRGLSSAEPEHPNAAELRITTAHAGGTSDPARLPPACPLDEPGIALGGGSDLGTDLVSVKLPSDVGRQLAAIADRRGSKRTLVAIEALSGPLRALAHAHREGGFPELPKVVSGTVRSSIAFALPPDLAADLDFVLRARRAVRAQIVTRLLAPAIRSIYEAEVNGRSR